LEAIRAVSFFHDDAAVGVAIELLSQPDDEYLRFVFAETMNTLERRAGSMFDRKNIAASLLSMIEKGKVPVERQPALLETVCRHGDAKALTTVWQRAASSDTYPPAIRGRVLDWLAEAATTRRVQPTVAPGAVEKLLRDRTANAAVLSEAIHVAAAW